MTGLLQLARYQVEDNVRDLIGKEISERVSETYLDSDSNDAILASIGAYSLGYHLPGHVLRGIQGFTTASKHAIVLSNLPGQEFPDTPVNGFGDETGLAVVNAIHLGLIRLFGCAPYAVNYENHGHLIRNVVPNPSSSGEASSWGSDLEFFWHSDNPHQPFGPPGSDPRLYAPPYLTFYAIRNEERVPTEIAALDDVVARLDDETRTTLQAEEFEVGPPDSIDSDLIGSLTKTAILEIDPNRRYRARYDRRTTVGCTDAARTALVRWSTALQETPAVQPVLETGDFMIFDNYRVLHRRKAFTPKSDARARWLRRCYAV